MFSLRRRFSSTRTALTSFLVATLWLSGTSQAMAEISQTPLLVGSGNVPGSLALVPSVEWPTILSVANLGNYSSANTYSGYFDAAKCYLYDATNEWFYPVAAATSRKCNQGSASRQWSGNFLNWAGTPTIDPFRSALTGGQRYLDSTTQTVLQKARHDGQSDAGNRISSGQGQVPKSEIPTATPANTDWDNFNIRLQGLGEDMLFSNWSDGIGGGGSSGEKQAEWTAFNSATTAQWSGNRLLRAYDETTTTTTRGCVRYFLGFCVEYGNITTTTTQLKSVYRLKIRVKVCDPSVGVESNCVQYGSNYKPEGLIQQYANNLRYSVFGYLNDSSVNRDGGVLRANQKYVGPTTPLGTANANAEWSSTTGIQVRNPNPAEATATGNGVADSGVINYLNKFGSMTNQNHKSLDPVSELYYAAIRYFKNQGNVSTYSALNSDTTTNYNQADGFPVVTTWSDPITYSCQKNVILGIGDVNTHNDKNLPGPTSTVSEPSKPASVSADQTVDVVQATGKVGALEGVDLKQNSSSYTGRNNSAYIAGLAYDSHTKDMRPNISGKQTLSTYWVDVRENQVLASKAYNQYWLAAKYGGFTVPSGFDPYASTTTGSTITDDMWWTSGDVLSTGDKRPDNFFVASDAQNMITSLKTAFSQIVQEVRSTSTSLASNSVQLDSGSAVFQTQLNSDKWSGDVLAKTVNSAGVISSSAAWSAATKLDALSSPNATRKIWTVNTPTTVNSTQVSRTAVDFTWDSIDAATKLALRNSSSGTQVTETVAAQRLAYLRGDRSQERSSAYPTRPFRARDSILGDIVNSDPLYIAKQDYGYNLLLGPTWGTAGSAYLSFRRTSAYQNRTPLLVVGANDGMLHGFNGNVTGSSAGSELFAYVPNGVVSNLYKLTEPSYSHQYYVDGAPVSSDAWINGAWKTLVVGTTGAGGKSVFALDVTNPSSMSRSNVLWEFTAPEMGYTLGRASIVALPSGKFGVVVSSGQSNSSLTRGYVWVLDAADGSVLTKFTVNTTGGMGPPLAVDLNNDRMADRIYVGDSSGKLWRMDLAASNASSDPTLLFTAADSLSRAQPITAPLAAALNTDGKPIVLFGTGSFFNVADTDISINPHMESFYGIVDSGTTVARNQLTEQKILNQVNRSDVQGRVLSNTALGATDKGWYLDLQWKAAQGGSDTLTGERVISKPILRNGSVVFTTLIPSTDPCAGGGTSWTMSINVFTGGRLTTNYFDVNGDGQLTSADYYDSTGGIPFSGVSSPSYGVIKTPTFFRNQDTSGSGTDMICFAGSGGGEPQCSPVPSGVSVTGRASWREIK